MWRYNIMNIKQLSKIAGVSSATVSYVLNDSGNVGAETRERILKLAKEYDYKPNRIAKSLRTSKSNTIGVIVEDITVAFAPEIIKGISKYADENGMNIILNDLGLLSKIDNKFEKIVEYKEYINDKIDLLISAQVDGIIYVGMHDRNIDNIVEDNRKPVVYVYCYTESTDDVSVTYDNTDISYMIGELFINKGHKRIAAICGTHESKPSYKRLCGFKKALYDNGIDIPNNYVKFGSWQSEEGYQCAKELLELPERPTAIFAFNDLMAAGAVRAARELGISVPGELSVIGFDNRELSSYLNPMLSTIKVPLEDMGFRSNELLNEVILNNVVSNRKLILPCTYIERESVG
jgi:LacI family transcriptional regulator